MHSPVVARVTERTVAGDTFALPLVEGVARVRVVAGMPASGAQVAAFVEAVQQVVPLAVRHLHAEHTHRLAPRKNKTNACAHTHTHTHAHIHTNYMYY